MYKHTEKCINIHTISGFPVDFSDNLQIRRIVYTIQQIVKQFRFSVFYSNNLLYKEKDHKTIRQKRFLFSFYKEKHDTPKNRNIWSKTEQYLRIHTIFTMVQSTRKQKQGKPNTAERRTT